MENSDKKKLANKYRSSSIVEHPSQFALIEVSEDEMYALFRHKQSRQRTFVKYTLHYIDLNISGFAVDPMYTFYVDKGQRRKYTPLLYDRMSLLVYGIVTGRLFAHIRQLGGDYKNITELKLPNKLLDKLYMDFANDYYSGTYDTNTTAVADEVGAIINGRVR